MMLYQDREDTVAQFSKVMGHPIDLKDWDEKTLEFRYRLIVEEVKELGEEIAYAMAESHFKAGVPDKVKARLLKELADVQYVLSGFAVTFGLPLQVAFNRVHASNMTKLGEDGKPVYRSDGKVLKGPNYRSPEMEDLFEKDFIDMDFDGGFLHE